MPGASGQDLQPAVFLDRDGTMNVDIGYVSSPDQLVLYPWAAESVRLINQAGLKAIVVTNQSGVARGLYDEETLYRIHDRFARDLKREDALLDGIYYCPHHPRIGEPHYQILCDCRKPAPGMLLKAQREHGIDLTRSFVIGDKASDIEMADRAGARSVLVLTGYGRETLSHPEKWPCKPGSIADNLLAAVKQVLDTIFIRR
jgi:D-glycero-D-manno-heptose 1,7-bisphosphate phosphatase